MKKTLATALMAASLVFGSSTFAFAADSFSDVPSGHWAYKSVAKLIADGTVNPDIYFKDKEFLGNTNVTRYDVALMLGNIMLNNLNVKAPNTASFSDLPKDHPVQKAAEILNQYEIMSGYGDGTFRGNKNITRQELALIFSNFLDKTDKVKNGNFSSNFSDIPQGHWAYPAISKLASIELMEGYGDGTFRGQKNMTRFELALIVSKINAKYFNK